MASSSSSTPPAMFTATSTSMAQVGSGTIISAMMATMPATSAMSVKRASPPVRLPAALAVWK